MHFFHLDRLFLSQIYIAFTHQNTAHQLKPYQKPRSQVLKSAAPDMQKPQYLPINND